MTKQLLIIIPLFFLLSCSNENDKVHGKQVDQSRSLDKVIQEGIEKRQEGIEE